jgi:hypothetical protein
MAARRFDDDYASQACQELAASGVTIAPGLSDSEIKTIELAVGSSVPPELRLLWAAGFPTGDRFPNWRDDPDGEARHFRDWIDRATRFDVEQAQYWHDSWGLRPTEDREAVRQALAVVGEGPPMIRVYSHRFMTTQPPGWGNPVLSVWQMVDSIYYGYDLADYLAHEFKVTKPDWAAPAPPRVPFWGDLFHLLSTGGSDNQT